MTKLTFSGHDTFNCRQFWLKKGLDHVWAKQKFNDDAVIELGVGRNMVTSIKYWVDSFGLLDDGKPNQLASFLFDDIVGKDPYIEDINSLWLLHFNLVSKAKASIYSIFFNEFRRFKIEFTREMFKEFILKYCARLGMQKINPKTIEKDIGVFILNYSLPEKSKGIESDFSGLLYELDLLARIKRSGKDEWYKVENSHRKTIAPHILLFCILYNTEDHTSSFSFKDLLHKENGVGKVFAFNNNGLYDKLQEVVNLYPRQITFTDNAGVKVLQVIDKIDCWQILKDYYAD